MRVLIAEDDPVSRRLLEAVLVRWGYEVTAVSDGLAAWDILQQEDGPKLAIIDWMMPGLDGIELCTKLRALCQESYTYVLLLTARSRKEDIVQGLDAGADDYITKPFDTNELKVRLNVGRRITKLQDDLLSIKETLKMQATHDSLTGLPNRLLFSDRLTYGLAQAKRHNHTLSVMFLDLDGFKYINDTLGHDVGDLLLKEVAGRLTHSLREADTIARMGGDEFTVILNDCEGEVGASAVANKILEAFAAPFNLEGRELYITTSVGISMFPNDGLDVETLVKNADTAMYRAKERGRNNYKMYTQALNTATVERMELETGLRRAIDKGELRVFYQPRVDIRTGRTLGCEALVRWQHPTMGLIYPAQFIPLAEETGLIVGLSEWVLHEACKQNKAWHEDGFPCTDVAVNISAKLLQHGDLVKMVKSVLSETGLDPMYLDLELTESTLMHNPDRATQVLREVKDMGVKISIDDFGTGYSSLSYLKRFPVDAVKIDKSFVKDIANDPDDAAISGAVVAMAHSLKLKVIAEGVETLEQLEFLRSLNCDEMQGYFISRPVPADELTQIFRTSLRAA